ncbi:hypothetical protein BDW02DRAFT_176985 [Decorospora gaudefroyi]|uniref:Uncharacterized protein n=1 Tax=Decorospora gaudefroyi TaxID=184978 RepID=A0A6A5JX01_9PLEO|nr:hypothetical protein BDW02DRAFT_176985 [Decorospora gaudefroyi]
MMRLEPVRQSQTGRRKLPAASTTRRSSCHSLSHCCDCYLSARYFTAVPETSLPLPPLAARNPLFRASLLPHTASSPLWPTVIAPAACITVACDVLVWEGRPLRLCGAQADAFTEPEPCMPTRHHHQSLLLDFSIRNILHECTHGRHVWIARHDVLITDNG